MLILAIVRLSCSVPLRFTLGTALPHAPPSRQPIRMMAARSSFRNPNNLPVKVCVVCQQQFTWRKKWERCWDEVTTCSKRCNGERKKLARQGNAGDASSLEPSDHSDEIVGSTLTAGTNAPTEERAARKAARKAAKEVRRATREGRADPTVGQKTCNMCMRSVDLLVRCKVDNTKEWKMVCGRCWNTDAVAGGVVDGSGSNPHYRYGGLWKNLKQQAGAGGAVVDQPLYEQLRSGQLDSDEKSD
ncbi:hypothetical protein AB1Y20_015601 [Prymnesium parvum]|uniref:Uncharacterized protein n=1 Tax=Prymnesium parvum TaxID=97485 RepID=A0AB34JYY5_PRYPA